MSENTKIVNNIDTNLADSKKQASTDKITEITMPIFPLSPDSDISSKIPESKTLKVYFDELNSIFSNDRIHNIAITGSFGIGKSSIISSYDTKIHTVDKDKKICNKTKRFLYVSLGSYNDNFIFTEQASKEKQHKDTNEQSNIESSETDNIDDGNETRKNDSQNTSINDIEKRLLLQIYARFNESRIPNSLFTLIQENHEIKRKLLSLVLSLWVLISILLLFYSNMGSIVFGIKDTDWIKDTILLHLLVDFLIKYKSGIHFFLYGVFLLLSTLFAGFGFHYLITKGKISSVTFKGSNAEMQLEQRNSESYLDKFCYDIVYCIECISDDIDHTIIFEDFDRLPVNICIEIFTRLREINSLINTHLYNKKPVRFVYVIDDCIIGEMKASKFFDYILPIIPILNQKTSDKVLTDNLKATNEWLSQQYKIDSKLFNEVTTDASIRSISHYIVDFRSQYKILNEYRTLVGLYTANNSVTKDIVLKIFAFAVYHTYWPLDYSNLINNGKSRILPICNLTDEEINKYYNPELLKLLVDKNDSLLTLNNLYFIGYTEENIIQFIINNMNNATPESVAKTIQHINIGDDEAIRAMHSYCKELHCKEADIRKNDAFQVILEAIKCDVRCSNRDLEWYFKDRCIEECLKIFCEITDIELKSNFIKLSPKKDNVYEDCKNIDSMHSITGFTENMLIELCRGIPKFPQAYFSIKVKGNHIIPQENEKSITLNETNYFIIEIRKRIKEGSV